MKRRLRKKKHLGEFQQLGFTVDLYFHPDVSVVDWDRITDEFVAQAIYAHGLQFGGGGPARGKRLEFVCCDHRYQSSTDEDKLAVESWLKANSELESYEISEFLDAWHSHDLQG